MPLPTKGGPIRDREGSPPTIEAVLGDLVESLTLLAAQVDDDECRFDHHGGCQTHGFHDFDATRGCPMVRMRDLVGRYGVTQAMVDAL